MMLFFLLCIFGGPAVLGYSPYGRSYKGRTLNNVLRQLKDISVQPDVTKHPDVVNGKPDELPDDGGEERPDDGGEERPDDGGEERPDDGGDHKHDGGGDDHKHDGGGDDHKHDGGGDDHKHDGGGDDHKHDGGGDDHKHDGGDDCMNFKSIVLNHLVGFPHVDQMSANVQVQLIAFLPVLMKAFSIFEITNDAETAAKQMVVGLVDKTMSLTENCPTTMFNRIILYAVGKSFHSVVLQVNKTLDAIKALLWNAEKVSPDDVMYYARKMFGKVTNALIDDVLSRLSEKSHTYIKTIYPTIVELLNEGKLMEHIITFLRQKSEAAGLEMKCAKPAVVRELYRHALHDVEERFGGDDFGDIVSVLPLSHFEPHVSEQLVKMVTVVLSHGVHMAKEILSGLRSERLGLVKKDHRLLDDAQLAALKLVTAEMGWTDDGGDEVVYLPAHELVSLVVKEEVKDFETLEDLFQNLEDIAKIKNGNNIDRPDPHVQLSENLNMMLKRKCYTYTKYLIPYGNEIPACSRID
ncbi:uncharacterized protein LOC121375420 [Gigantopelta aegis]|uniref:uncharacterized protein LOC121375420 n=1 Tax=Gigantopelta aegis TaxID=1735272 RepID=UPI001B88A708|nr:uncharacterized protein LOC121375420 [Gigantopelta aegis]